MKSKQQHRKIIISGGGTGGHIFPAISIARALLKIDDQIEILFVGANGRMEMERPRLRSSVLRTIIGM